MENKKKTLSPDQKWYNEVRAKYTADILRCVKGACVNVLPVSHSVPLEKRTQVSMYKTDTVSSLFAGKRRNKDSRYAVLNFASYLNPGGGFLKGAKAQEEALCHQSILYPVLNAFRDTWYYSHAMEESETYSDDFILIPECLFIKGDNIITADVLTMAAVNHTKLRDMTDAEAYDIMRRRMETAYVTIGALGATRIILGAWGCGVFQNDPALIAEYWKEITKLHNGLYEEVIHAVPDSDTYNVFKRHVGP